MQIRRKTLTRRAAIAGAAFMLMASLAAFTSGQDAPSGHSMHHGHDQASDETARSGSMGGGCHEMMEARKHMMAEVDTMNSSLDGLIAEMDAAGAEKKIDIMAKVIHELVDQRQQMAGMMASAQPTMMAHMMSHMGGDGAAMKTAMAECPAMKGMMGASDGSKTADHESHH